MAEAKPRTIKRSARVRLRSGVLKQFHCEWISYDFEIPRGSFDVRAFSRKTGIKSGKTWNAGIYPESPSSGYHVHFRGIIEKEVVRITIEYWDGVHSAPDDSTEPHAETMMQWLGTFVREPNSRCMTFVRFEKPIGNWRSRFNLPFRVTTSNNLELTIDGVSILLPKNEFKAFHTFLTKADKTLNATVAFGRSVQFADFNVANEITEFNGAVNMFAEHVP